MLENSNAQPLAFSWTSTFSISGKPSHSVIHMNYVVPRMRSFWALIIVSWFADFARVLYLWNRSKEAWWSGKGSANFWLDDLIPHVIQEATLDLESLDPISLNIPMSRSICFSFSAVRILRSRVFHFQAKWVTNKCQKFLLNEAELTFRGKNLKIWGKLFVHKLTSWEFSEPAERNQLQFRKISWLENQFIIFLGFSYNLIKFLSGFMKALSINLWSAAGSLWSDFGVFW